MKNESIFIIPEKCVRIKGQDIEQAAYARGFWHTRRVRIYNSFTGFFKYILVTGITLIPIKQVRSIAVVEQQAVYRHELKYPISIADYLAIRQRLRPVMRPDSHTGADGRYKVRSIYFDNIEDKALREKINGVQKREKFRIRYYNNDFSFLTLEKKTKCSNLCMKRDARITEDECRAILDGQTGWMRAHPDALVREFYHKMGAQQLRPRVLVSYTREPYVYEAGNVRVTFDSEIRTSLFHRKFLETSVQDIPAASQPGDIILEVKFDAFLPEIISDLLQTEGIRQQAFSKYGACRRFG